MSHRHLRFQVEGTGGHIVSGLQQLSSRHHVDVLQEAWLLITGDGGPVPDHYSPLLVARHGDHDGIGAKNFTPTVL